ncbi:WhiB family transcriptional regulator [Actinomadura rubrisoli]|uniref:Transcriptional regulator WhiB n=2 Tax=Actinomadura rubrisoli TaxID=2530368 RepID=A0A4V2YZQ4_9ACTN|nr:WhiB family transcriptional regulator [Actinomadura rubrisoli]
MPPVEDTVEAAERWEAATKVTDLAAGQHACELNPARGVTLCTHPDHDRDADAARDALDALGLPSDQSDTEDTYTPPAKPKARLGRSASQRPDWAWQDQAACRGKDLTFFFGAPGEPSADRQLREFYATRFCRSSCPVLDACRTHAFERNERDGVWGGLTEDQRKAARRNWQRRQRGTAA